MCRLSRRATNLAIDDDFARTLRSGSAEHRTKRDAVNVALREYVRRRGASEGPRCVRDDLTSTPLELQARAAANVDRGRQLRTIARVPSERVILTTRAPGGRAPSTRHRAGRARRRPGHCVQEVLSGVRTGGTVRPACFLAVPVSLLRASGSHHSARRASRRVPCGRRRVAAVDRARRGPHAGTLGATAHDGPTTSGESAPIAR